MAACGRFFHPMQLLHHETFDTDYRLMTGLQFLYLGRKIQEAILCNHEKRILLHVRWLFPSARVISSSAFNSPKHSSCWPASRERFFFKWNDLIATTVGQQIVCGRLLGDGDPQWWWWRQNRKRSVFSCYIWQEVAAAGYYINAQEPRQSRGTTPGRSIYALARFHV